MRAIVYARDGGTCVRCGGHQDLTIHHRVNRDMGGDREEWINQAHNLLLVCTVCNSWFGANPRSKRGLPLATCWLPASGPCNVRPCCHHLAMLISPQMARETLADLTQPGSTGLMPVDGLSKNEEVPCDLR
ncbi:HNH endonuclease [Streptomyces sp. NPDC002758]